MAFCRNCGEQVPDNAAVCMKCGCAVSGAKSAANTMALQPKASKGFKVFVIIAVGFLAIIIGFAAISNLSDPEGHAVNCCNDYLDKLSKKADDGGVAVISHSKPELLDSTGNVYYFYVERATGSAYVAKLAGDSNDLKVTTPTIVAIRVDSRMTINYTCLGEVPMISKSDRNEALEKAKKLYGN